MGSTAVIESPTGYTSYWIDEPAGAAEIGNVMASSTNRANAVSVLGNTKLSGPPMQVDPFGNQTLFLYSPTGAPACEMVHFARWQVERLA
jgi:hypothetical protein